VEIQKLLAKYVTEEKVFQDKDVLIKEGSKTDGAFVLLKGQAKVQKRTHHAMVTIDTLKPGAILGEMFLLAPELQGATATVIAEGSVRVGYLNESLIRREFSSLSPRLREVIRALIHRLYQATEQVGEFALKKE
jgi:CRP-like cAMP-binding protein